MVIYILFYYIESFFVYYQKQASVMRAAGVDQKVLFDQTAEEEVLFQRPPAPATQQDGLFSRPPPNAPLPAQVAIKDIVQHIEDLQRPFTVSITIRKLSIIQNHNFFV